MAPGGAGVSNAPFFGQQHVTLGRVMKAQSGEEGDRLRLDLEDRSGLHSQTNLLSQRPQIGRLVFHKVVCGPKERFRDDSLVGNLTFPDKQGDGESDAGSQPVVIEKLIPPSFDIMLIKELLAALDRQNILALLSGMFNECQIVLTSQNNFRLKAAINCLLRLMYPFHWQHTLVPLLPRSCIGMLSLKQPYIIAVNQFVFPSCIELIPKKAIVVFLDHNQIRISPGSFIPFPSTIKNRLSTAIQQFRVMLFRSLVRNKDPGAEGFDSKLREGFRDFSGAKGTPRVNKEGDDGAAKKPSKSHQVLEVKVTAPKTSSTNIDSTNIDGGGEGSTSSGTSSFRSRMAMGSGVTRPEVSLQILKRHFLDCFVSLFYKFRLYWTGNPAQPLDVRGFLNVTKAEYRPFVHKFVRTRSFGFFIETRAVLNIDQHSPTYVFDEMVYRKIYDKYRKIRSLEAASKHGKMLCQKGKSRWKMRSVEVLQNKLNVYKYNKKKGAKYTRVLKPGWFQLEIPAAQLQSNFYSFELRNIWEDEKDDSTLTFRVSTETERHNWVKAIQVRIMDSHLRSQYEFVVSKLGPRFAAADSGMASFKPAEKDRRVKKHGHKRSSTLQL
mmetsp:Transcript_26501/g.64003  ORF Transcript_26501/g.64003 Transcript_26501/m.64003 type:complete len:606 (-) Transcript_26501:142-1959(-)